MNRILTDRAEKGLFPDALIRRGIRRLLEARLRELRKNAAGDETEYLYRFLGILRSGPVAADTGQANRQHYELPTAFFEKILGKRLKYSACLWPECARSIDDAEEAMLELTCRRAGLSDGQRVLDLGCGWGSLSLWMAGRYPGSRITAVSNSSTQRETIVRRAAEAGLGNLTVLTADINDFKPEHRFDRIVSIEMFEHMRNLEELFARIAGWMEEDAKLFVHIFCRAHNPYLFEVRGPEDWMARHFFSGGMMPSEDLMTHLQQDLFLERHWRVGGLEYARTLRVWLRRLDAARDDIMTILVDTYGVAAGRWLGRWRMFFLACEELFRFNGGKEWFVGHFLYTRRPA